MTHSPSFKFKDEDAIRELRRQGVGYSEIGRRLNRCPKNIAKTCKKLGLAMTNEEIEASRKDNLATFKDRTDWQSRLDSIYGFGVVKLGKVTKLESGESRLSVKCGICGEERTLASSTLRKPSTNFSCAGCRRKARADKEFERQEQRRLEKVRQPFYQVAFPLCECGAILPIGRNKTCSSCQEKKKREAWRVADVKRRARERKVKRDKDITLEKLFKRDNGICYLCGIECNWNDSEWKNGVFIVGRTYPTIDHVQPIVKGGSHTWGNIRLAHLSCNSKKHSKELVNDPR